MKKTLVYWGIAVLPVLILFAAFIPNPAELMLRYELQVIVAASLAVVVLALAALRHLLIQGFSVSPFWRLGKSV